MGEHKASELWGIDISEKQNEKAEKHLAAHDLSARLVLFCYGRRMWHTC